MIPEKDDILLSKKQLLARIDVALGGRVAEEIIFGLDNITSGASSDFDYATRLATKMVTQYVMTDALGPVAYREKDKASAATQKLIEDEIKKILKESHDRAYNLLKTRSTEHRRLAEGLLKYETLDAEEVKLIVAGKSLQRTL
jgi:ATP-dependent metalloprotease